MNLLSRLRRIVLARLRVSENEHVQREPSGRGPYSSQPDSSLGKELHNEVDPELAAYYANLEIPYGSDLAAVRRAWKRLVKNYHPDLHSDDPEKRRIANELTQGINHAYKRLADHLEAQMPEA